MSKNIFILIGVMVAVGLISALLTYMRTEKWPCLLTSLLKALPQYKEENVIFFGLFMPLLFMPLLVRPIAFYVYRNLLARSADTVQTKYLFLAIGIAIVFTILAAVVFKMRGFVEFTALHVLYVAGFGWVMPKLLTM